MKTRKVDVLIVNDQTGEEVYRKDGFEIPEDWSDRAATIVASKYSTDNETSAIEIIDRVVYQIEQWGLEQGYFPEEGSIQESAQVFYSNLKDILINQRAAFNSPVWFNCGVKTNGNQMSACFILPVEDTMDSILNHTVVEGNIFKGGSGAGINVSKLRAKGEKLSNKGEASGPVSFMRGWDAFAGVIKSGGKVRRAAKLVCMDVDHPDIMEFIECKYHEERKAKILIAAGVSPEEAYSTVDFQNANHSIRVTDGFMELTETDKFTWKLINRGNKEMISVTADEILHRTAEIAWETGDPGIQFDDRMNEDNPVPSSGRINSTNPCSEFSAVDNSSCNLASLNLVKYIKNDPEEDFDWELFRKDIAILVTAMDILIDAADYPTPEIRKITTETRPLGLGFTNLGAMLILMGMPYDSNQGRETAAIVTKELTTAAYKQSFELANKLGSFKEFDKNKEENIAIAERLTGSRYITDSIESIGLRNSQLTLLAPTGTISFMMDADTTGIEPLFALKSIKTLAGGGRLEICPDCVNDTITAMPEFNETDGLTVTQVLPQLSLEKQAIFKTANEIHWKDHILMMAACQKHLNGAISKTVNMPTDCTVEDIEEAYKFAWKNGIKALAIYRDGSKQLQPLVEQKDKEVEDIDDDEDKWIAYRRKLPETRQSMTHKFNVGGLSGYLTCSTYEDGELGEIFVRTQKQGTIIQGLMDAFATSVSLGLQYGVPLETLIEKFIGSKFEPAGITTNEDVRIATSIIDYIFRWLQSQFVDNYDDEILTETSLVTNATTEIPITFDGPLCYKCQTITSKVGTCFLCPNCGETNGCG